MLFERSTLKLVNYDIVSNNNIINYTPVYKKGNDADVSSQYERLKNNDMQILDSCHYVFLHGLLSARKTSSGPLQVNYPSDLWDYPLPEEGNGYGFTLYKTNSDWPYGSQRDGLPNEGIKHYALYRNRFFKTTPCENNMNLRYQVFDYYLPLSDVEKLDTIKIIKHNNSSIAN